MNDYICPKCASPDTQTFEMAYQSGVSETTTVGVAVARDGASGIGVASGTSETGLAQSTRPPRPKSVFLFPLFIGWWVFGFLLTLVTNADFGLVGKFFVGLFLGPFAPFVIFGEGYAGPFSLSVKVLAGIAIVAGSAVSAYAQNWNEKTFPTLAREWSSSWLCKRCGYRWRMAGTTTPSAAAKPLGASGAGKYAEKCPKCGVMVPYHPHQMGDKVPCPQCKAKVFLRYH